MVLNSSTDWVRTAVSSPPLCPFGVVKSLVFAVRLRRMRLNIRTCTYASWTTSRPRLHRAYLIGALVPVSGDAINCNPGAGDRGSEEGEDSQLEHEESHCQGHCAGFRRFGFMRLFLHRFACGNVKYQKCLRKRTLTADSLINNR